MGSTTYVTHVTNYYGITEEELYRRLGQQKDKFEAIIKGLEYKNVDFKNQISEQKNKIDMLKLEVNHLEENYQREIKENKKENNELKSKLFKTKKKLDNCLNAYNLAIEKNKEIQKQLDNEKKRAGEYLQKWIESKEELKKEKQKNIELQEAINARDEIIDFLDDELEAKGELIDFLNTELEKLNTRCEDQKNEINMLKNDFLGQVTGLKNDIGELKKTNKIMEKKLDDNNNLIRSMKENMEKEQKEKAEMKDQMNKLNSNMDAMMGMMQKLFEKK